MNELTVELAGEPPAGVVTVPLDAIVFRQQGGVVSRRSRPIHVEAVAPAVAEAMGVEGDGPFLRIYFKEP